MQSPPSTTRPDGERPGVHVAILMDGNGRWATARGLPRPAGHQAGADALRHIVEAAPDLGIRTLTVYALSSDKWHRPKREVMGILRMLRTRLRAQAADCLQRNVRISVIGRRDRLPRHVLAAIEDAERLTRDCDGWHFRIAVDYSARHAIAQSALRAANQGGLHEASPTGEDPAALALFAAGMRSDLGPDVDLVIRTGGEQRLSDFLLWECSYAELYFTPTLWPDFDGAALADAVAEFRRRDRRFGRVPALVGAR